MDDAGRKALAEISETLKLAQDQLRHAMNEEQEAQERVPENQYSNPEWWSRSESAIDNINEAIDVLGVTIEFVEDAQA